MLFVRSIILSAGPCKKTY